VRGVGVVAILAVTKKQQKIKELLQRKRMGICMAEWELEWKICANIGIPHSQAFSFITVQTGPCVLRTSM